MMSIIKVLGMLSVIYCLQSCSNLSKGSKVCQIESGQVFYSNTFESIHGKGVFFDFDQAIEFSRTCDKPILVIFGGWYASYFKEFYESILDDEIIQKFSKENFILVYLYVDDRSPIPGNEWVENHFCCGKIDNLGKKNVMLQTELFKSGSQPYFGVIDKNKTILLDYYDGDKAINPFKEWLEIGLEKFNMMKK